MGGVRNKGEGRAVLSGRDEGSELAFRGAGAWSRSSIPMSVQMMEMMSEMMSMLKNMINTMNGNN